MPFFLLSQFVKVDAVVLGFVCLGVEQIHPDTPEDAGTLI